VSAKGIPLSLSPSVVVLVLANLVPVYGVLFLRWDVFPVLLLFWLENVIVGIFNAARMLAASPNSLQALVMKIFLIPFFLFHYGAFTAAHGVFVVGVFGQVILAKSEAGFPNPEVLLQIARQYHLFYAAAVLAASHGFSFVWNYIGKGEYRRVTPGKLMGKPYGRVAVLHITIILGGFLVAMFGSSLPALVLLIVLKVGIDLRAHVREHRTLGQTEPS
jgi:hypothetical protein